MNKFCCQVKNMLYRKRKETEKCVGLYCRIRGNNSVGSYSWCERNMYAMWPFGMVQCANNKDK